MNTIKKVIVKRLKSEWQFQFRMYRNVLDWSVMLYIVIPFLIYAVLEYLTWWNSVPLWMDNLGIEHLWGFLFLYLFIGGGIRLFAQEADLLFLQRNRIWMHKFKLFGCVYTILIQFILTILLFICVFPILHFYYQIHTIHIVTLLFFTFLFKVNLIFLLNRMRGFFDGWKAFVVKWLMIYIMGFTYIILGHLFLYDAVKLSVSIGTLLFTLIVLVNGRLKRAGRFNIDLHLEQQQRMSMGSILYKDHIPPNSVIRMKHPLVFRKSTHLFRNRTPINVIVEICIKAFVRNKFYLKKYLFYTLLFVYAVSQTPIVIQIILISAHVILFSYWIKMYGQDFLSSRFIEMYPIEFHIKSAFIMKSIIIIVIPSVCTSLLVMGISLMVIR